MRVIRFVCDVLAVTTVICLLVPIGFALWCIKIGERMVGIDED